MKKEPSKHKEVVDLILKNNTLKTGEDVSDIFTQMYGEIIQTLLDKEMDIHLGYDKNSHEEKETENRRNGVTSKTKKIKTKKGEITVTPPRDREGTFEPQVVKKRQRVLEGFDDIVTSMYAKGMTLLDIQEMLRKIYNVDLSKETISELTSAVNEKVIEWQKRQLKKCYAFLYVDCLYCPVKTNLISEKTAIYIILGIDLEGQKEVLGIWIDKEESACFWQGIFEEIMMRGVEEILFISMDGLKGLNEAIERVYPKTITQRCVVHLVRNIYNIIPRKRKQRSNRRL